ncbi:MAG: hypothetical protein ACFFC0_05195 [Promethearchaeota archaeon]
MDKRDFIIIILLIVLVFLVLESVWIIDLIPDFPVDFIGIPP